MVALKYLARNWTALSKSEKWFTISKASYLQVSYHHWSSKVKSLIPFSIAIHRTIIPMKGCICISQTIAAPCKMQSHTGQRSIPSNWKKEPVANKGCILRKPLTHRTNKAVTNRVDFLATTLPEITHIPREQSSRQGKRNKASHHEIAFLAMPSTIVINLPLLLVP